MTKADALNIIMGAMEVTPQGRRAADTLREAREELGAEGAFDLLCTILINVEELTSLWQKESQRRNN